MAATAPPTAENATEAQEPDSTSSTTGSGSIYKHLPETNIRQRGNIDGSMIKLGRIAAELERIYKIKNGTNRYTIQIKKDASANGESLKTQKDIAEMLGVSVDTIIRAKKIATMPPEWQELVETGKVSVRTARAGDTHGNQFYTAECPEI